MDNYLRICGGVVVTIILGMTLNKQNADIAAALTIFACCMILTALAGYLQPVTDFLWEIQRAAKMDDQMVRILLKAVGIGLISEIAMLICSDSGNGALGKGLQILASTIILSLCLPMMRSLLDLLEKILGEL